MIGYYLFVCMIYVVVIFLVYKGHCCYYSIEIFVVDYDSYHCLLFMIYVLGLATVNFVGGYMLLCFSRHYTLLLLCSHFVVFTVCSFCPYDGLLLWVYIP